jgi:hypothetical protein
LFWPPPASGECLREFSLIVHTCVAGMQSTIPVRLEELDSQEEEDEDEEDDDDDDDDDDEEGIIVEFCQEDILEEVLEHAVSKIEKQIIS